MESGLELIAETDSPPAAFQGNAAEGSRRRSGARASLELKRQRGLLRALGLWILLGIANLWSSSVQPRAPGRVEHFAQVRPWSLSF